MNGPDRDAFALLLASLAAWQAVEVYRHGGLFARARAAVADWRPESAFGDFAQALLSCAFCLSVWAGVACGALAYAGGRWSLPLWPLAVSRLSNLFNDLSSPVTRTPGRGHGPTAGEEFDLTEPGGDAGDAGDAGGYPDGPAL